MDVDFFVAIVWSLSLTPFSFLLLFSFLIVCMVRRGIAAVISSRLKETRFIDKITENGKYEKYDFNSV